MKQHDPNAEVMRYYSDIIDRPHPVSQKRAHMSRVDRAAQFSPFAALTGHSAAIQETARLTESDIDLAEDTRAMLDLRLDLLQRLQQEHPEKEQPEITVTYFCPDEKKAGGTYIDHIGMLKRVDAHRRRLLLSDGADIPIDRIVALESDIFSTLER